MDKDQLAQIIREFFSDSRYTGYGDTFVDDATSEFGAHFDSRELAEFILNHPRIKQGK